MAAKGFHDVFVILDTFRKSQSSRPEAGVFIFDIIPQNYTREHVLGITKDLTNVVEMQINSFQLASLPRIITQNQYDTGTSVLNSLDPVLTGAQNSVLQTDGSEEISIYVEETGTQSVSNCYGRDIIRYNFQLYITQNILFDTHSVLTSLNPAPRDVTTNPIRNRTIQSNNYMDTYRFQEPTHLDRRLSLTFRDPDAPLVFLPDVYYNVEARYVTCLDPSLNPIPLPGARAYLVYLINNHRLQVGDVITIKDSNNNFVGPAKTLVGPSYDVTYAGTTILAANVMFTNPTTYNTAESSAGFFTIYVHTRRMRIPMRFRKLVTDE